MSMNMNNTTIKRLMTEMRKLASEPDKMYVAGPASPDDLFLWHFTIKGTPDSPFEGGVYHGKIVFPQEYPLKPPDIYFLTPNGRFDTNKKLCLSFTSYHPEQWNPGWDVRTVLTSVIAFLPTKADGAIGGIDCPVHDRKQLAIDSRKWKCKECSLFIEPDPIPEPKPEKEEEEEEAAKEKEGVDNDKEGEKQVMKEEMESNNNEVESNEIAEKENVEQKSKEVIETKEKGETGTKAIDELPPKINEEIEHIEREELEPKEQKDLEPKEQENLEPKDQENLEPKEQENIEPKEHENLEPKDQESLEPKEQENLEPKEIQPQENEEIEPKDQEKEETKPNEEKIADTSDTIEGPEIPTRRHFYPFLDIGISLLFIALCFLIMDSHFNWSEFLSDRIA